MNRSSNHRASRFTVNPALQLRSVPAHWNVDRTGLQGRVSGSETGVVNGTERAKLLCLERALLPTSRYELTDVLETRTALSRSRAERYVDRMIDSSLLVRTDDERAERARTWVEMGWAHALHYHLETRDLTGRTGCDWTHDREKRDAPDAEFDPLPDPEPLDAPVEEVMLSRSTCRDFDGTPVSKSDLGTVLGHGSAPLDLTGAGSVVAASSPSASVFDVYPIVLRGTDVEPGVYRYDSRNDGLRTVKRLDSTAEELDRRIREMLIQQPHVEGCAFVLAFVTRYQRAREHFDSPRQLRDAYVGLSMYAHRHLLVGTALGLGTFQTAAHHDRMVKSLLSVESHDEHPEYVLAFGGENDE